MCENCPLMSEGEGPKLMWGLAIDVVDYLLMWGDIDVGGSPGVVGKQTVDVEGPPIDVGECFLIR